MQRLHAGVLDDEAPEDGAGFGERRTQSDRAAAGEALAWFLEDLAERGEEKRGRGLVLEPLEHGLPGGGFPGKGGEMLREGAQMRGVLAERGKEGAEDLVGPDFSRLAEHETGFSCQNHPLP